MSGVYNRKLFRQSGARDELRKMGGIMSSSEELMREALRTAMQAPGPSDLGPMPMPMPQQPMGMPPPPVMQPQQPMMPMQRPMAAPAFMPPSMPPSVQPQGFKDGGPVSPFPARAAGIATPKRPTVAPVDITKTAGTAVEAPKVDAIGLDAFVERVGSKLDTASPEEVGNEIVENVVEEPTGDLQFDLAKALEEMTGDPSAYEKDIDTLNRGIIGAAIAAGTSARATENIAKGMLVGLESAKQTEERRAGDARALQLKALEVRAAEQAAREAESKAGTKAQAEAEAKLQEDKRDVYTNTFNSIIEAGVDNVTIPKGMSIEEYAAQVARAQVEAVFGEGSGGGGAGGGGSTKPTLEQFLAAARVQNPSATDAQLTEYYNSTYGG